MLHADIAPSTTVLQRRPARTKAAEALSPAARLIAAVGAACDGPALERGSLIVAALKAAVADPRLLAAEQRVGKPDTYCRHVLGADPDGRFTVMSLVWGPGQFSPPHAHHTWCAYAVVGDPLTETVFGFDEAAGRAIPLHVRERHAGYACFAMPGLDHIHRLGNAGVTPAVSVHVYGVEPGRIATGINRLIDVA